MRNVKNSIGLLCSVMFCVAIAVGVPHVAKTTEKVDTTETIETTGVDINADNFPDEVFR